MQLELAAGIFAGSEQKEGCWEFIRFTLMDPTANMHISSRPLYRPLFDEMLEANVGDYPNQISIEEATELRELVERRTSSPYTTTAPWTSSWRKPEPISPARRAPNRRQGIFRTA